MNRKHDSDDDSTHEITLGRRSYLALAGTVATGLAGCAGRQSSPSSVTMEPLELFGYGGAAIVARESVSVSATSESEVEPNDSRATATPISVGTETTAELTAGDADWFAFDASAGDDLSLRLTRASGDGIAGAILYGSDGSFLDMVYSGSTESVVTETADTSGTYFAEIVDINDGTGSYTVAVTTGETSVSDPTPTPTETPTQTPTPVDDEYGQQGYGELGYGGV